MNSVHEPCPKIDSETVLSQKLGQKPSQVHHHRTWPSWAHPSAHRPRACIPRVRPAPLARPCPPASGPARSCNACAPQLPPAPSAPAPSPAPAHRVRPACAFCLASAQMGSSPFQVLHFFFFHFPLVPATGKF